MPSGVRESVAAGTLYAADSQDLRAEIDRAVNAADSEFTNPKALVVPDCGLAAAPEVTAAGMIMLETERDHVNRVIVIGDWSPTVGERQFAGVSVPRSVAFRTPLGDLLVDRQAVESLASLPSVVPNDRPFRSDTSIEVHLPPIQRLLGSPRVVPMLVGDATATEVVDILERVWGGRETLLLVTNSFARGKDPDVVHHAGEQAREAFARGITPETSDASSPRTLEALSLIVNRRSMGLLELAAETMPNPHANDSYVDVSAFGVWESTAIDLAETDSRHLRRLATSAVQLTVLGGQVDGCDTGRIPPALMARRASVVTLRRDGQTRGSAGTIEADRPLAASVIRNAAAACSDPRLPSITPAELPDLEMTISIVSPIERVFPQKWADLARMIEQGRHGLLMTGSKGRAAQLPAMWSRYPSHDEFIAAVAEKANLSNTANVADVAIYRFSTLDF